MSGGNHRLLRDSYQATKVIKIVNNFTVVKSGSNEGEKVSLFWKQHQNETPC